LPSDLDRDLTNEADAFGMGAKRPYNPAALGGTAGRYRALAKSELNEEI
jgi:hypothetical protein